MAKMELPYEESKVLEYARCNPNLMAQKIMKANVDDFTTHSLINKIRSYMFGCGSFESLTIFNEELTRLGWGKGE